MTSRSTFIIMFVALLLGSVIWMNRWVQKLKPVTAITAPVPEDEQVLDDASEPARPVVLTPDNPSKYHIAVQSQSGPRQTQKQWDEQISKTLTGTGLLKQLEDEGAFAYYQKNPKELQRRIVRTAALIQARERELKIHPTDQSLKSELQTLYMLRATLGILQEQAAKGQKK